MPLDTPWQRAKKTRSQRQEERLGNMPGGQKQNNSGRFWRWKRDTILHNFLIEARDTEADSYSVKRKEFHQIKKEALQTPPGLLPAIQVDFTNLHLIVIELAAFQDMNMEILELRAKLDRLSEDG